MDGHLILAHNWGWQHWAWLVVPLAVYGLTALALFAFGRTDESNPVRFFFGQISDSLRRATGFPGWAMAGVLSGLIFLLIVVIGFYWDVAWHIDNGRDEELFTPSHVMILVGLGGLIYAAAVATLFATLDRAEVGLRVLGLRVPWSALVLLSLGIGGVVAFPLDDLWHKAYGVDVTLWSPTHLQLVAGGSLGTIALFLMCAEALPAARPTLLGRSIHVLTGGTILVAMSTFQGEFDYGVPQFQVLYLPVLIMAAAGFSLVLARITLGPWGAVKATLVYLALRSFLALVVGGVLNHTVPRFPLYLFCALAVEAAAWWLGTDRRLRLAVAAGLLMGTVGLVGELSWVVLSGWAQERLGGGWPQLAKIALLGPLAAVAAGVLGAGLARAYRAPRDTDPVPVRTLVLAGVALLAVLAFPLPRRVAPVEAVIRLDDMGGRAMVEVELDPPDAARNATAFAVSSWQGGGRVTATFQEIGPGLYRTTRPVPITAPWKSTVALQRGDQVMAAPIYLPADPEIGAAEIPAVPERREAFVRNTVLLLRETHDGPAWPAVAAYSGFSALVAVWVALMALTARRASEALAPAPEPVPVAAPRRSTVSRFAPAGDI